MTCTISFVDFNVFTWGLLCTLRSAGYRAFSLTWPADMQIYWNKRKPLHMKRIQLPQDVLVHQHGCRFIVLEHQYGRRDVMWKRSILLRSFAANVYLIKNVLFMSPRLPDSFCLFVCFSFFSKEGLFLLYNNKKANGKQRRTNKRKERKHLRTKWFPKLQ